MRPVWLFLEAQGKQPRPMGDGKTTSLEASAMTHDIENLYDKREAGTLSDSDLAAMLNTGEIDKLEYYLLKRLPFPDVEAEE